MPALPADVQPVEHELRDRIITGLVTGLPVLGLGAAVWQADYCGRATPRSSSSSTC